MPQFLNMPLNIRDIKLGLRLNDTSNVFEIFRTMCNRLHHDEIFRRWNGNADPASPFYLCSCYREKFEWNPPLIDIDRDSRSIVL